MTHANNFNIPVHFRFRPYKMRWYVCSAEVISEIEPAASLVFCPPTLPPPTLPMFSPLKRVRARVHLPLEAKQLSAMLESRYDLMPYTKRSVEMYVNQLPSGLIGQDGPIPNNLYRDGCWLTVLVCQREEFRGGTLGIEPEGPKKNAWVMRDEFLNLEKDVSFLCEFLNRWGMWSDGPGFAREFGISDDLRMLMPHHAWTLQETFRKALIGSSKRWHSDAKRLVLSQSDERPYFFVDRSYCRDAIEATITIDHLSNAEFGICKRHDCRRLFQHTTKQRRLYCSPHCAHLANVRKLRAAKKKESDRK